MRANRKLLAVVVLALASVAAAQQVYRSVGPDGKVVFSDTPPADREAVSLPAGRAKPVAPATVDERGAQQATAAPAAGQPSKAAVDAGARSLAILIDTELLVQSFESTCVSAAPASASRYSGAANAWRSRHAALLAKRDTLLGTLAPALRQVVMAESRAGVQRLMQPVHNGQPAQRVRWCDQSAEDLASGKLDRYNDPRVTEPMQAMAGR